MLEFTLMATFQVRLQSVLILRMVQIRWPGFCNTRDSSKCNSGKLISTAGFSPSLGTSLTDNLRTVSCFFFSLFAPFSSKLHIFLPDSHRLRRRSPLALCLHSIWLTVAASAAGSHRLPKYHVTRFSFFSVCWTLMPPFASSHLRVC